MLDKIIMNKVLVYFVIALSSLAFWVIVIITILHYYGVMIMTDPNY